MAVLGIVQNWAAERVVGAVPPLSTQFNPKMWVALWALVKNIKFHLILKRIASILLEIELSCWKVFWKLASSLATVKYDN